MNTRDFSARLTAPVADNAVIVDLPRGIVVRGKDGFRQFHEELAAAFPDTQMTISHLEATDNHVFVEAKCEGQNTGDFGVNPPTNRVVNFQFTGVYVVTDGEITRATFDYDEASVAAQLGISSLKAE